MNVGRNVRRPVLTEVIAQEFRATVPLSVEVPFASVIVYGFRNSKIIGAWTSWDALGLVKQLGLSA